jgi:hypothetical protein
MKNIFFAIGFIPILFLFFACGSIPEQSDEVTDIDLNSIPVIENVPSLENALWIAETKGMNKGVRHFKFYRNGNVMTIDKTSLGPNYYLIGYSLVWEQNGQDITIATSNKYTIWTGKFINEKRIIGNGKNEKEKWTFDMSLVDNPKEIQKYTDPAIDFNPRNILPSFSESLKSGDSKIKVENGAETNMVVCLMSEGRGSTFFLYPTMVLDTKVLEGNYDVYLVFANDSESLYRGDSFTIGKNQQISIKFGNADKGNYGLEKLK